MRDGMLRDAIHESTRVLRAAELARFGALIVNLTDAVLPGREITLEIDAFCGKLISDRAGGRARHR